MSRVRLIDEPVIDPDVEDEPADDSDADDSMDDPFEILARREEDEGLPIVFWSR